MTRNATLIATLASFGLLTTGAHGATIIANGNWSAAGTWSGGVPNAIGATAENTSTSSYTLTLDIDATAGTLRATNRGSLTVNSNGTNFLTMNNGASTAAITGPTGGSSSDATLAVNPNVTISGNLLITQNANTNSGVDRRVDINGDISGTGNITVANNENAGGGVRLDGGVNHTGTLTWGGTNTDTTWSNITGSIGSNVTGFTKNGAGYVTLSGTANAWAGGTTINTGQVRIAAGSTLGAESALLIADGAILNLLAAQVSQGSITSLTLGANVFTTAGTYGHSSSNATFTNDTFFAGTGFVTVIPEPASLALLGLGGMLMLGRGRREQA